MGSSEEVKIIADDDIIDKDYVRSQISCLIKENTETAICQVGIIDDESNIISTYNNWNIPFFIKDKPYLGNIYLENLLK